MSRKRIDPWFFGDQKASTEVDHACNNPRNVLKGSKLPSTFKYAEQICEGIAIYEIGRVRIAICSESSPRVPLQKPSCDSVSFL